MKNKVLNIAWWVLLFGALLTVLQLFFRYQLFYIEQWHMFRFDAMYARTTLLQIGGLVLYASEFLVQLFMMPWVGAIITALLLTLSAWLVHLVNNGIVKSAFFLFSLLPIAGLVTILDSTSLLFQAIVAYVMALGALVTYIRCRKVGLRFAVGVVMGLVLFFAAGSVAVLYALCVMLWELLTKCKLWSGVATMVVVGMIALISVHMAWVGGFRLAFLPDMYLRPEVDYMAWWLPPLCMVAVRRLHKELNMIMVLM